MKVQSLQTDHFQEIGETFELLNYFLRIFALNCIVRRGIPFLNLVRMAVPVVIVGGFDLFILIYKFLYIINAQIKVALSTQYLDVVQSVYNLLQYLVDMYYVYKYGADLCLEYVNRYCYMDGLLAMRYYSDIKRILAKFLCFILTVWFVTSLYDCLTWAYIDGAVIPLYFLSTYIHMLIKLLTNVNLSLHIMHVEYRLRTLGDQVEKLHASCENLLPMSPEESTWFRPSSNNSILSPTESVKSKKNVRWFRCYYLLITEQVKFINRMFGMRLLLNTLSLLLVTVRLINLGIKVMGRPKHAGVFHPSIGCLVKVLMCAALLISVVRRSERAYKQRRRLLCLIDNLLVSKRIDDNVVEDIKDLYSLVQVCPISFNLANFVRIDNSLLVSTASTVVTYSIILLQSVD